MPESYVCVLVKREKNFNVGNFNFELEIRIHSVIPDLMY